MAKRMEESSNQWSLKKKDGTLLCAACYAPESEPAAGCEWCSHRVSLRAGAAALRDVERLREALSGILGIGKRDMTNPKYDGYFDDAKEALAATDRNQQKEAEDATR